MSFRKHIGIDVERFLLAIVPVQKLLVFRVVDGKALRVRISPSSESDLLVEYVDKSGTRVSSRLDIYLEPGTKGTLEINIQPKGVVTWKDETKV